MGIDKIHIPWYMLPVVLVIVAYEWVVEKASGIWDVLRGKR